ncbi:hypothetical protein [Gordonia liuliyuniae]|uniref:NfeD-like C-terminal domain-containing protein n=1 Tax=Gordonia liuliyuniae TaxID=2911517 RepID=A0ABS9IQD0_9ACTN|nr:hypothetical protein [Gordonia liuliyuniae]MCF8587765.1 hypothetical protein [Gordonia liuliyuniae]
MLGIVLLAIGLVGLFLTLLSLIGFEFGSFDIHLGDSGAGLVSVATPFLTGFGLLSGGLIVFDITSTPLALLSGAVVGILLGLVAFALLGYLVGSEEELPSYDLVGSTVRIVEPVVQGRFGTAEVRTPLGARQITVTSDESLAHNEHAVIVDKIDGRESFHVSSITFGETTHPEGNEHL